MRLSKKVKRTLRAEALESRQLLHGGGMAGGGDALTTEDRATEVVGRFDANEDLELSQDEVSERLWNRIADADGDDSGAVSIEELTAHLDAAETDRVENRAENAGDRRHGRRNRGGGQRVSVEERIDRLFAESDTNGDSLISAADDVSEALLDRIADADVDGDGVSAEDLLSRHETRKQERFDARFDALDGNDDGGITADEVSERRWEKISAADGEDGDGVVTADELQAHLEAQRAERSAERELEGEDTGDGPGDEVASEGSQVQQSGRGRAVRRR